MLVKIREKKNNATPKIIAPKALVATNVIARSTRDVSIEPRIPVRSSPSVLHTHTLSLTV